MVPAFLIRRQKWIHVSVCVSGGDNGRADSKRRFAA